MLQISACVVRSWSLFLALFEVQVLVRVLLLDQKFTDVVSTLGSSPSQFAQHLFLLGLAVLALSRFAFSLSTAQDAICAETIAFLHAVEVPVIGIALLNFAPAPSWAADPQTPQRLGIFAVVTFNAVLFYFFAKQLAPVAPQPSLSHARSVDKKQKSSSSERAPTPPPKKKVSATPKRSASRKSTK